MVLAQTTRTDATCPRRQAQVVRRPTKSAVLRSCLGNLALVTLAVGDAGARVDAHTQTEANSHVNSPATAKLLKIACSKEGRVALCTLLDRLVGLQHTPPLSRPLLAQINDPRAKTLTNQALASVLERTMLATARFDGKSPHPTSIALAVFSQPLGHEEKCILFHYYLIKAYLYAEQFGSKREEIASDLLGIDKKSSDTQRDILCAVLAKQERLRSGPDQHPANPGPATRQFRYEVFEAFINRALSFLPARTKPPTS